MSNVTMLHRVWLFLCALVASEQYARALEQQLPMSPTAIARVGRDAWVADGASGRVIACDPASGNTTLVVETDGELCDIASLEADENSAVIVIDSRRNRVFSLRAGDGAQRFIDSVELPARPTRVALSLCGEFAAITSHDGRCIFICQLDDAGKPTLSRTLHLSFAPRCVLALPQSTFVVTDAYGGQMAIIDPQNDQVAQLPELRGHQIRGLCLDPNRQALWIAHQQLSRVARTSFDDIHWGNLMRNTVTRVAFDHTNPTATASWKVERSEQLGEAGAGFADPTSVAFVAGRRVVLSGGVGALLVGEASSSMRMELSGRPTTLCTFEAGRVVIIAPDIGAVTGVAFNASQGAPQIEWTITSPQPLATRGERAFYDGRISHDGWMSCNSCHIDGHSSDLMVDTKGDGGYGAPKRIPALFGVSQTAPHGWLGNQPTLHDQLHQTLETTMHFSGEKDQVVADLIEYLATLKSPSQTQTREIAGDPSAELGSRHFKSWGCAECHVPNTFTSTKLYDVGLTDELNHRQFNPPSLLGVSMRTRLLHDGRARSVSELMRVVRHQIPEDASEAALTELEVYLNSL